MSIGFLEFFEEGGEVFYENFERICFERGVKPARACVMAGLDSNRASNWKGKSTIPKQSDLDALAKALDCRVADFFMDGSEPIDFDGLDEYETELLTNFRILGVRYRLKLLQLSSDLIVEEEAELHKRYGA